MSNQFLAGFDRSTVPQWDWERLSNMQHDGWYDGPLDGTVFYKGKRYYFDLYVPDYETHHGYQYVAFDLTPQEWQKYEDWKKDANFNLAKFKGNYDSEEARMAWELSAAYDPCHLWEKSNRVVGWF